MKSGSKRKTKRQRHKASILQKRDGRCYLCMLQGDDTQKIIEEHHIFGGPRRAISEAEGLKCYLCPEHHRFGSASAHMNAETRLRLQRLAQMVWEIEHSREEWMELMGKNYRTGEEQ